MHHIDYTLPAKIAARFNRDDGLCGACSSVPASEWHHIHPRNLGGADDSPQIHLCGSCHNLVHKTAFRFRRAEDVVDVNQVQSILSKYIAKCMGDSAATDDTPRKIVLQIPDRVLRQLHIRKVDAGYKNLQKFLLDKIRSIAENGC